jgi:tetratricopeptide (TPR) repeat protein
MRSLAVVLLLVPGFAVADAHAPADPLGSARSPTAVEACGVPKRAPSQLLLESETLKKLLDLTPPNDPDRAKLALRTMLTRADLAFTDARQRSAAIAELRAYIDRPDAPTRDEALFALGQLLELDGKAADAREVWMKMIGEFPKSARAARAQLAFGDISLAEGRPGEAIQFYQKVLDTKDTCSNYARYKAGLAWLQQKDPRQARAQLYAVVAKRAPVDPVVGKAVRRALVEAYAGTRGDPAQARIYFVSTTANSDEVRAMLALLVERYRRAGDEASATVIERDLAANPR